MAAEPASPTDAPDSAPPPQAWLAPRKVGILSVLYLVQGLPFGFFMFTFPIYFRAQGHSLVKTTLLLLANIPWLLKPLWAPAVDKYFWPTLGRRRSWIIPSQGALVLTLAATAVLVPYLSFWGLIGCLVVVNVCAATQDIAVDGLAVDILAPNERGVGNSVQAAAYKVGMLGGGFGLTAVMAAVGIAGCLWVMAAIVAVAMAVPLLLREPPPPPLLAELAKAGKPISVLALIVNLLRRRSALLFIGFLLLVKAGDSLANPLFRLAIFDLRVADGAAKGATVALINNAMNLGGIIATLLGSAVCGYFIAAWGRRRALWISILGQGVSHLGWAALAWFGPTPLLIYSVAIVEHFVSGMLTVVVFTLMMDAVHREAGGTLYSVLMSIYLGSAFGLGLFAGAVAQALGVPTGLGGALVDYQHGFGYTFAIAGLLTLSCLLLLRRLDRSGYLSGSPPPIYLSTAEAGGEGLRELIVFCAVGASGLVVDYAVFVPLVHFDIFDPRVAAVFAFAAAVSWNYALNRRYTFRAGRQTPLARSYAIFVGVCLLGVGVRVGVMHVLMVYAGWAAAPWIYAASFVGIVAATAINFLGSKHVAFRG